MKIRAMLIIILAMASCGWGIDVPDFATLKLVGSTGATTGDYPLNGTYVLTANIDASSEAWTPISSFTGTFDGDGYTINYLHTASTANRQFHGMFASPSNTSTIKDLTLLSPTIDATGVSSGSGTVYVGTIAAQTSPKIATAAGTLIDNCVVINATIIAKSTIDQPLYVGGVVGSNHGNIEDCTFSGTVSASKDASTATYGVSIGGIAGYQTGATGAETTVNGILRCTSSATISNYDSSDDSAIALGGIVGTLTAADTGTDCVNYVTSCVFTGVISHTSTMQNKGNAFGGIIGSVANAAQTVIDCGSNCSITVSGAGVYASAGRLRVGGMVGGCNGVTDRCFSNSRISVSYGDDAYIGGAFGSLDAVSNTTDCYATGTLYDAKTSSTSLSFLYSGGFVGGCTGATITNSFAAMTYTGRTAGTHGGFYGVGTAPTLTRCFWNSTTSTVTATNGDAAKKTTTELQTVATFTDFDMDSDGGRDWKMVAGMYPILDWQTYPYGGGSGTTGSPYLIKTTPDFLWMLGDIDARVATQYFQISEDITYDADAVIKKGGASSPLYRPSRRF